MKKSKFFAVLVLSLALVFCMSLGAFATEVMTQNDLPTVSLRRNGEEVEFYYNREDKNLFDNFTGLMPGDEVEQKIIVNSEVDKVVGLNSYNLYLYAIDSAGDVSKYNVEFTISSADRVVEAVKTSDTSHGAHLGLFNPGDEVELTVTMKVPTDLTNEAQGQTGIVDWVFYAEQVEEDNVDDPDVPLIKPEDSSEDDSSDDEEEIIDPDVPLTPPNPDDVVIPNTGVDNNKDLFIYAGLALVSGILAVVMNEVRRKKIKE